MKTMMLAAAVLLAIPMRSEAGATNGPELKQLVKQYLPGCALKPEKAARPRTLVSAAGEQVDLLAALRENPEPKKKKAGYWLTPTMTFLSKQRISVGTANDAAAVIQLLHVITRGAEFVQEGTYSAIPIEGGWVVEAARESAKSPAADPPYELLVDASQHVTQIRERCYAYRGSARVYEDTVQAVYEREMKRNGGINYPQEVVKELAKAWEKEKAQKTMPPETAPKK